MFFLHATHHIDTPDIKKDFYSASSMLQFRCSAYNVTYLLQRRMPWLEDRWRTQRTVLHISNCRFPRKIRILNAFCELGLPNSRGWQWSQYAVNQTLKFGWLSHVVASVGADVIVEVSVSLDYEHKLWHQSKMCLHLLTSLNLNHQIFFLARSWPVTGLPAEFKHINKWRSKN